MAFFPCCYKKSGECPSIDSTTRTQALSGLSAASLVRFAEIKFPPIILVLVSLTSYRSEAGAEFISLAPSRRRPKMMAKLPNNWLHSVARLVHVLITSRSLE